MSSPARISGSQVKRLLARGTKRLPGQMNRVETAYAGELELRKKIGDVVWFRYEAITLKLAHDTRFTADFAVMLEDGTLELHDCKGSKRSPLGQCVPWIEEDALIKLKAAAEYFPLKIVVVWFDKARGFWLRREF